MRHLWFMICLLVLVGCAEAPRLIEEGNEAFVITDYGAAIEAYETARGEDGAASLPESFFNAANAYHQQGQDDLAERNFEQAIVLGDSELQQASYFNLGNIYYQQGHYAKAVEAYREVLWLAPDDRPAKHNLELALHQLEQTPPEQEQDEQNQDQQSGDEESQDQENQDQQSGDEQNQQSGEEQNQEQQESGEEQEQQQGGQPEEEGQSGEEEQTQEADDQATPTATAEAGGGEGEDVTVTPTASPSAGSGSETDGEPNQEGTPQPVETIRLSPEQARQLLESIARESETIQQYLLEQQGGATTEQDW